MPDFTPDTDNEKFHLAIQLVNQTDRNIFLTGKAGTGKTTFLKYIRENCPKQMAVLAPTGVAAINAGGVTIHSFFQLPLSPFIPVTSGTGFNSNGGVTTKHSLLAGLRFNNEKRKLLRQLQLLIIDEISMVRCDILDAIDLILRHFRHRPNEKFGGVQMLLIGDMHQLPPIVRDTDWSLLSPYYAGPYFFNSLVLQEDPPLNVEFDKIYRQNETRFLELLNQVRDNQLTGDGKEILESRFNPGFYPAEDEGYIILTTHNLKATEINSRELEKIKAPLFTFTAEIQNDFPDRAYPAENSLQLKVGAQVMFVRNDSSDRGKRYFNGKIGTVSKLETGRIWVKTKPADEPGKEEEIEVPKEKWENVRYKLDKKTAQLETETLGSFSQFPLRLAWAITIHKSQGLTFQKAIIDAGDAFAPGQVYVALSRCTNLDGLVLRTRIKNTGIFTDPVITTWSKSYNGENLLTELEVSRRKYLQSVTIGSFAFENTLKTGTELFTYILEKKSSFNEPALTWSQDLIMKLDKLVSVGFKFQKELAALYQPGSAGNETNINERLKAATVYFVKETSGLIHLVSQTPVVTDSWVHSKELNELFRDLMEQLSWKKQLFENFPTTIDEHHQQRKTYTNPAVNINVYAGSSRHAVKSEHQSLYQKLRELRDEICSDREVPIYMVAGSKAIDEMARYLPQDISELRQISGFGEVRTEQYGEQFLDIIISYSKEKNLSSLIHEKSPKRQRLKKQGERKTKKDTRAETFRLFQEGKSIEEIATERSLSVSTIEGHLADYIKTGQLDIDEVLSYPKLVAIENAMLNWDGKLITELKMKAGNEYSFGDIRFALAWFEFKNAVLASGKLR